MIPELLERLVNSAATVEQAMELVCRYLAEENSHYDWVGFYMINEESTDELVLGPYIGAPTDHTHIKLGQGVCGRSAAEQTVLNIADVRDESNYLSCSLHVKSELVIPLIIDGNVMGVLDIDSHQEAAFTREDEEKLKPFVNLIKKKLSDTF